MAEHREADPPALTGGGGVGPPGGTAAAPGPNEPVCFNCAYRVWAVALGIGVLCRHPANAVAGRPVRVPGRGHSCGHFEGGPGYTEPRDEGGVG